MPKAYSVRQVNVAIKKAGGNESLVYNRRGGSYFYFVNVGPDHTASEGIYVYRVSAMSVDEWLERLQAVREKMWNRD